MDWLQDMLAAGVGYHPIYLPSRNSDHLPMSLCAIAGLGGSEADAHAFADDYCGILHPVEPSTPLDHWREGIGIRGAYAALFDFFQMQVAENGRDNTVAEFLPEFVAGIAQEAFHPLIRLGYALQFDSDPETAAALAYLVSTACETPLDGGETVDLESAMRQLADEPGFDFSSPAFGRSIRELIAANAYPAARSDLNDCAAVALSVSRSTRNFFALHMVTATQAMRVCAPLIDLALAETALTSALLAAYRVVGTPDFAATSALPAPTQLGSDHTFKYVWSCLSEYRNTADDRYIEEIRTFRDANLVPAWAAADI